jgi:hypothetical protein
MTGQGTTSGEALAHARAQVWCSRPAWDLRPGPGLLPTVLLIWFCLALRPALEASDSVHRRHTHRWQVFGLTEHIPR